MGIFKKDSCCNCDLKEAVERIDALEKKLDESIKIKAEKEPGFLGVPPEHEIKKVIYAILKYLNVRLVKSQSCGGTFIKKRSGTTKESIFHRLFGGSKKEQELMRKRKELDIARRMQNMADNQRNYRNIDIY